MPKNLQKELENPDPHFVAVDKRTGQPRDASVLEEAGIAYDPTEMTVDLTKDEKRRTTALMLAIQAYEHLIIKDAEYLREVHAEANRKGTIIQPATMDAMVEAAISFDAFIAGYFSQPSAVKRSEIPSKSIEQDPVAVEASI